MSAPRPPLTDAQRQLIDEVCAHALGLEPGERHAFVESRCANDQRALDEVLEILASLQDDDGFLDSPVTLPPIEGVDRLDPEHRVGEQIGAYRVTKLLGEGGFALVYLAEQQRPMRREVALKVLKPGMDSRAVVSRFEGERQALAIMDHPGVASVYDGGVTPDGVPYFVMELVRGEPITRWCDHHSLGIEARLRLFIEVCDAVQHAHQKGVIHRDLKPSNVLVHERDGSPFVKVIDFGIAKALNEPLVAGSAMTLAGQFVGTPEYMPPEQMDTAGASVDTRTDVYALGVILYELLCASRPIDAERLSRTGLHEMSRLLREEPLIRPSVRAARMNERAASSRSSEASSLMRRIEGDLDWIAMTCLAPDRDERYASVGALSSDIRRFLDDEPIEARPPSRAYRMRKFVRRNRVGVVVGGVIAALVIASAITIITLGASALNQAKRSAKFNAKFLPALADIDRENLAPRVTSIEKLIDEYASDIDIVFADYPSDRADLHRGVGLAYLNWDPEKSITHFRKALDTQRSTGSTDRVVAEAYYDLSRGYWHAGRIAEGEQPCRASLEMFERIRPTDHKAIARGKQHLAAYCRALDRFEESEQLYNESLALWRELGAESGEDYAQTLYSLALLHLRTERFDLAARECLEVLAIIEPISEPDSLPLQRVRGTLKECEDAIAERGSEGVPEP
ncbi:MAG: serine/threonine protein kinase [Phycisphaeraceae bacterium]|nr:serine/threonine protein kinase [Phycisphaerales bacterium]MCB9841690.1 serine/threonine protein kinase [Phycisphaeraceae bacterium]